MDINNVLTYLKEELRDIPAKPDNVHYTNLERLYYILQTGLEGQQYYRTKTHRTKDDDMELATVRGNHNLTNKEKRSLSSNVERGGVKINLFTDRILASVRGAKKAPIAEFPVERRTNQKKDEEYFRKTFGFEIPKLFDSRKAYFTNDSDGTVDKEIVIDWLKKNEPAKLEEFKTKIVNEIYCYNRSLFHLKQEVENREREERFILKKNIPINSKLMEIVIDKKPEDYSMYDDEFIEEVAPNYLTLVNRYDNVFLHNKEFRLFKNYLRKKINDNFSKNT